MAQELVSINVRNVSNRALRHCAVTYGVPLAEGALQECKGLSVRAGDRVLPVQTKVLQRHADGSVRWLLLDFAMPLAANEQCKAVLVQGERVRRRGQLRVEDSAGRITVTTARLSASISKKQFSLFESYKVNGVEMIARGSDVVIEMPQGKQYRASAARNLDVRVIERGDQRVVVQCTGRHAAGDGSEMLTFRVRYTFRPHEPGVEVSYKFTNMEEPEQGVRLGSIRIVLPTALGVETTKHIRQCNSGRHWLTRLVAIGEDVELLSGKAYNEAAKARYGSAADGKVVIRNFDSLGEDVSQYPYYLRPGNARTDMTGGLRATYPYLGVSSKRGSAVAWFYDMGQNFPKSISCSRHVLAFDVWPACAGELHLRRGMSKEHDVYVCLSDAVRSHEDMERIYFDHEVAGMGVLGIAGRPVEVTLDPDYARSVKVLDLHRWLRNDEKRYLFIEAKLGTLGKARQAPQVGMLDYGDYVSPDRSATGNNENDAILESVRDYYRRANYGALVAAVAKARHNAHVDFIAYDPDPLRQGTMPAHCPEHTDGAAYPSHMWVGGLLAAYCVTGEPDFEEAALSVGENMLRWQSDQPGIFYIDSRECGWPMLAYLQLHEHTGEQRWLAAARTVFEFYREKVDDDGLIRYELPHGLGLFVGGYGEFIAWRACFFYHERTGEEDVKAFLVKVLPKVCRRTPGDVIAGGWACNDLFPAWAAYALTGDDKYIEDNYDFLRLLMKREGPFPWGGVDVHYYLNELDRRGVLDEFQ